MKNSKDKPLVSVLMTVFNRGEYITEAINSVLKSSYQNFELIIVDDCSTDNSLEVARKFAIEDSRIKVYLNEENLGQFQNRNRSATYAKGKYIKFLDSDDIIYPHGLEVMVCSIEEFQGAAFATSYPKPEEKIPYPILLTPEEAYKEQFLGRGVMDAGPSAIIFNRLSFIESGGFREDGYVGNDTELLFRLSKTKPMVKMPTALVWWRQHEGQAFSSGNVTNEYLLNQFQLIVETITDPDCPMSEIDIRKALKRQKQHQARKILILGLGKRKAALAWQVLKKSKLSVLELIKGLKPYM